MTNYELMFILNPKLDEEKREASIANIKEIIESEGQISNVDLIGMKKLAYPIQKLHEGYYTVINFTAPVTLPKELDRKLRIYDEVMRHIIINKDEK